MLVLSINYTDSILKDNWYCETVIFLLEQMDRDGLIHSTIGRIGLICLQNFYALYAVFSVSEYADEAILIPKNTSVLIRRVPGRPRKPIVAEQEAYLCSTFLLFCDIVL